MLVRAAGAVVTCAIVLVFFSCAQPGAKQERQRAYSEEAETRHWVQSERLRVVMDVLERDTLSTWPQEVENEYAEIEAEKAGRALAEAGKLAEALVSSASRIPEAVMKVRMSEADRRAFVAQADTLRDQAQLLYDAAAAQDLQRMRTQLDSITATCRSCHDRFRDFSGPMN